VALLIRARLRWKLDSDTRIAMAIGPVASVVTDRISQSSGEVFTASGRLLDEMKRVRLALAASPHTQPHFPWIGHAINLLDLKVTEWTPRQAEAVALVLLAP
jgi:hypothetical protein